MSEEDILIGSLNGVAFTGDSYRIAAARRTSAPPPMR
jgi:hypothetical protein